MFYIYKIINKINNKVYIGKTGRNIDVRWREHCSKASQGINTYLYNAIRKYGEDNFIIEEIDKTENSNEINLLEQKWITFYDSSNKNKGYNLTKGGDGNLQYDWDEIYFLWDKGLSIKEISEKLKCNRTTVGEALKFHSSYSLSESLARSNWQKISILQYDKNKKFIKKYSTITEAAKENNCSPHTLFNCIKNQTYSALGFYWVKDEQQIFNDIKLVSKKNKVSIIQYSLNDKILNTFQSAAEAARFLNPQGNIKSISSCIIQVCRGKRKTAYGYKWKYLEMI